MVGLLLGSLLDLLGASEQGLALGVFEHSIWSIEMACVFDQITGCFDYYFFAVVYPTGFSNYDSLQFADGEAVAAAAASQWT